MEVNQINITTENSECEVTFGQLIDLLDFVLDKTLEKLLHFHLREVLLLAIAVLIGTGLLVPVLKQVGDEPKLVALVGVLKGVRHDMKI